MFRRLMMRRARTRQCSATAVFLAGSLLFFATLPLCGTGIPSHSPGAVDHKASYLIAVTGTSGLLGFVGHRHAVLATDWSADLKMNLDDLGHSRATLTIPTDKLVIDSSTAREKAGLGKGPSASDVRTIQKRMLGSEVLDATKYPQIRFTTTAIESQGNGRLRVTGNIEIHGRRQQVTVPVRYKTDGKQLEFDGDVNIRQTDFGLQPESVAGGTIKVKNSVSIRFHIVTVSGQ